MNLFSNWYQNTVQFSYWKIHCRCQQRVSRFQISRRLNWVFVPRLKPADSSWQHSRKKHKKKAMYKINNLKWWQFIYCRLYVAAEVISQSVYVVQFCYFKKQWGHILCNVMQWITGFFCYIQHIHWRIEWKNQRDYFNTFLIEPKWIQKLLSISIW